MMRQNVHLLKGEGFNLNILLDQKLGEGAFGAVYRCVLEGNESRLAVKTAQFSTPAEQESILNQIMLLSRLPAHPNIIKVYPQLIQSKDNIYYVMEQCENSLSGMLDDRDLTEQQLLSLYRDMVSGLVHLAGHDLLHQDIKPANILFKGGRFKLADFGIALNLRTMDLPLCPQGTLIYVAPQKLLQNYIPEMQADIYALGVVLYQAITLRHPYISSSAMDNINPRSYYKAVTSGKPKHPCLLHKLSPVLSCLSNVVMRMIVPKAQLRVSLLQLHQFTHSDALQSVSYLKEEATRQVEIDRSEWQLIKESNVDVHKLELQKNYNTEEAQKIVNCAFRLVEYTATVCSAIAADHPLLIHLATCYAVKLAEDLCQKGLYLSQTQIMAFLESKVCLDTKRLINQYTGEMEKGLTSEYLEMGKEEARSYARKEINRLIELAYVSLSTSLKERSKLISLLNLLQLKKVLETELSELQFMDDDYYSPREYLSVQQLLDKVIAIGQNENLSIMITIDDEESSDQCQQRIEYEIY